MLSIILFNICPWSIFKMFHDYLLDLYIFYLICPNYILCQYVFLLLRYWEGYLLFILKMFTIILFIIICLLKIYLYQHTMSLQPDVSAMLQGSWIINI